MRRSEVHGSGSTATPISRAHGGLRVDRFMHTRHVAKLGPVGAHPSVRGHYSNAGRLSSG
jgi:hypothetical protein